jgi:hypothetical protein
VLIVAATRIGNVEVTGIVGSQVLVIELRVVEQIESLDKDLGAHPLRDFCILGDADDLAVVLEHSDAGGSQRRLLAALGVDPKFLADD